MRRLLILLAAMLAALLALGACEMGCATPKPTDTVTPAPPPTAAEVMLAARPALKGFADSSDEMALVFARAGQWRGCVGGVAIASGLRSIRDAFGHINSQTGASSYCVIPGVDVKVDACGDVVDWLPLLEADAADNVDRYLGIGLPAARGLFSSATSFLPPDTVWVSWVDAALAYLDGARRPLIAFLVDPSVGLQIPTVTVVGCEKEAAGVGLTVETLETLRAMERQPGSRGVTHGPPAAGAGG